MRFSDLLLFWPSCLYIPMTVCVCVFVSLGPWLPWFLTPVFLAFSHVYKTPDSVRGVSISPSITQYLNVGYCTTCSSEVNPGFYSQLIQNCKWKKFNFSSNSNKLSHLSSTRLFPPICPVTVAVSCRSSGSLPSLRCLTLNQTLLCCMWWQQQWKMSALSPRALLFPSLAPCFCLSCWLFQML